MGRDLSDKTYGRPCAYVTKFYAYGRSYTQIQRCYAYGRPNLTLTRTLTRPYPNFASLQYFMAVALNRSFCFSTVRESNFANTWCDVSKYSAASFSKSCQFANFLSKLEAQLLQRDRARFVSLNILLIVTQGHSKWHCWVGCVLVPISISFELYVVPFLRYSASENDVILKLGVGVVQDHWKWSRSIDHTTVYLSTLYCFWVIWRWIILWPWNLG